MNQTETAIVQTVHAAAEHGHAEAAHELPNFLTVLHDLFPKSEIIDFLHRWENFVFSAFVLAFIVWRFIKAARQREFLPKGVQNRWEIFVEAMTNFVTGILGPRGTEHVPFLGTLFIFILLENLLGIVPLMKSPTSAWSTTIALALVATVYVQWVGVKDHGIKGYTKHMAGNPQGILGLTLMPLMLVINASIEYFAVPLSLSLRLFANVSSEDRLLLKFAELNVQFAKVNFFYIFLPFFFQLFANILVILFSLVQAFVFLLLTTVYISLISPNEGHGPETVSDEEKKALTH